VHFQNKTMIIDLTGKRAIVTGSTSGIGFVVARGVAETGAAVVLYGRTKKSVDAATKRLARQVPQVKVEGIAVDLAAAAGVATFVKRVSETDILMNNLNANSIGFETMPT
jgi:short-subunit dehydrogenase